MFFIRFLMVAICISSNLFGASLKDIDWLAGSWSDGKGMEEHFTTSSGGKIVGVSKLVMGDKLAFFEFFEIDEVGGNLVLKPKPFGVGKVLFTSTEVSADLVRFENAKHDFPKKIIYTRKASDEVSVSVEGTEKGIDVVHRFEMKAR